MTKDNDMTDGSTRLSVSNDVFRPIEPVATWRQLSSPQSTVKELREICRAYRPSTSLVGLFTGMDSKDQALSAEAIAGELGLQLLRIDLATVASKYIEETEANLKRLFDTAESAKAILYFDDADALFGKRSEVRDSHDRYANMEIDWLLQRLESCPCLAILSVSSKQALDNAFLRRMRFVIHFPA